jgi:membrane protease YdiL (CAAX protease family)
LPLGFIWWLGWWEDAGFVTTTENAMALTVPLVVMVLPLIFFGTVAVEARIAVFFLLAFFLTGLAEEALSRGLLFRAFLPRGKWQAVLIPSVLFGLGHITQFLSGEMALRDNLVQIANALIFGILYGAVRLRVNNIWPLIVLHALGDIFAGLAGFFGPTAIYGMADVPAVFYGISWALKLGTAIYLVVSKPAAATIEGQAVG